MWQKTTLNETRHQLIAVNQGGGAICYRAIPLIRPESFNPIICLSLTQLSQSDQLCARNCVSTALALDLRNENILLTCKVMHACTWVVRTSEHASGGNHFLLLICHMLRSFFFIESSPSLDVASAAASIHDSCCCCCRRIYRDDVDIVLSAASDIWPTDDVGQVVVRTWSVSTVSVARIICHGAPANDHPSAGHTQRHLSDTR